MADPCAQYVSTDDLKAAKESIVHIEHVATSKDANGNPALVVTDPIRGVNYTNTTLDGLFSDIAFKPVNGSFEDGGTLVNRWDVLLYETNGSFYQWMGDIPSGGLVVSPGSSPFDSSGNLLPGWVDQNDLTLRADLASSAAGKGSSLVKLEDGTTVQESMDLLKPVLDYTGFDVVGRFLNIAALRAFTTGVVGQIVFVASAANTTNAEVPVGGGYFKAIAKGALVDDGGITIVPATGAVAWVRTNTEKVYIEHFGARGDGVYDSTAAILAAMAYGRAKHVTIYAGAGIFETSSAIPISKRSGLVGVGREQTIFEKTSNDGYPVAPGVTPDAFIVILGDIYDPDDLTGASDASWLKVKSFTFRRKGLTGRANAVQYGIWAPKMNTSLLEDLRIECGYYGFWGEDVWSNVFTSCQFLGLGVRQFAGFQIDRFRSGVHALSGTSNVLNCVGVVNYQIGFNLNSQQYITLNSCTTDGISPMVDLGETDARAYAFINPHGVTMNGCGSEGVAGYRLTVVMDNNAVYDSTITINSYQGQIVQENPLVSTPIFRIESSNTSKFCSVSLLNCNIKKDASLTNQSVGFITGVNTKVFNIGSILDVPTLSGGATFTSM